MHLETHSYRCNPVPSVNVLAEMSPVLEASSLLIWTLWNWFIQMKSPPQYSLPLIWIYYQAQYFITVHNSSAVAGCEGTLTLFSGQHNYLMIMVELAVLYLQLAAWWWKWAKLKEFSKYGAKSAVIVSTEILNLDHSVFTKVCKWSLLCCQGTDRHRDGNSWETEFIANGTARWQTRQTTGCREHRWRGNRSSCT